MKKRADDPHAKPKPSAYNKALGLLARREHSRKELRQKLDRSGYARDEASEALERLGTQHYQDDDRFAEALIRNRSGQGYGPMRLRAELKSHGLADNLIRDAVDAGAADIDWLAQARARLQHRYGQTPAGDHAERARRVQYLLRRGFDGETARAAADSSSEAG